MCAWYLAKSGHHVTILDRDRFGAACSHGNCGYVSPSHVLPLTTPGGVRKAIRGMFSRRSPIYIKPRFSLDLWSWLWKFSRRCNERDMLEAAQTIHLLLQSAKQLYVDLIESERLECEWQAQGNLLVFQSEHEFHGFEKTNDLLAIHFDMGARPMNGAELVKFEPALIEGLGGAWFYDDDCHLRPDKLMSEMRRKLTGLGVQIVEQAEVNGFVKENGNAVAAKTSQGEFRGSRFVAACGAWTPFLNKHFGCKIAIQPGKGYSITMPRPKLCPSHPIIFEQHRVAITPMNSGYRIGSTMEFSGYDATINERRLSVLKDSARLYLREPYADPIQEKWFGWRPMTWDSKPYIDRAPAFDNVWVAAGHNMLGLSMATVTGKLISEMINGQPTHLDVQALRLDRT